MKAILLDKQGGTLSLGKIDKPTAGEGEVRIKVHAVGLNPADVFLISWGSQKWTYPHVLGLDIAGTIDEIGKGVNGFKIGDEVFCHHDLTKQGGFTEYVIVIASVVALKPKNITMVEGASFPCTALTAYACLYEKLHITKGHTILIHGGAGGVGSCAIQMAKHTGCIVYTTCSSENIEYVKNLGADYTICYKEDDWVKKAMELTNNCGMDYILDTISPQNASKAFDCLAFNGQLVCIAGAPDKVMPSWRGFSVHEELLGNYYTLGKPELVEQLAQMWKQVVNLISEKILVPVSITVISLEEIPETLQFIAKRHVKGKYVAKLI